MQRLNYSATFLCFVFSFYSGAICAEDYGTQKKDIPPECDQQGNGPVECPNGLTLQWGDTISATKATTINITGDADLQNATISGGITINVNNGNLRTNSGFSTDGALNVSGTITFANNNTVAGNISAGTINASNGSNNNYQANVTVSNSFTGGFSSSIGGNLSGGDIITGSSTVINGSVNGDNITLAYQTTVAGNISASSLWTDSAADIGGSIQAGSVTIGSASNVAGSISGSSFVQLAPSNSTFSGSVSSNGDIYIGSGNSVTGFISGNNITTDSPVIINGNINANGDFDLASGSQVNGDVNANNIVIRASNSEIDGTVIANGDIVIGSGSGIDGSASADSIEMQDSNAYITENAFADTLIDIGWGGSIGGDATAPTIINDSGDANAVAGGRYCDDSNSSVDPNDAFECQTGSGPADPGDDSDDNTDYTLSCQQLAELSQYGIVGSSSFTAGSGSVINDNDIEDEDGNTPTPQGTIDTVDLPYPPLEPSTFPTFSGGSDVTNGTNLAAGTYDLIRISGNNGQTTFAGGTYFIEELRFSTQNNSATLAPGTYYIGELNLGNNSSINIAPEGQVKIYIRDGVNGGNDISFNNSGRTRDLIVYLYDNADFVIGNYCNSANNCPEFTFNGSIYSPYETVDIEFGQNTNYKGSALTQGTVSFGGNTEITYSEQDQRDALEAQGCDPDILDENTVNHYRLVFPSSTVSCLAAPVQVLACQNQPNNADCDPIQGSASVTVSSSALSSEFDNEGNSAPISLANGAGQTNLAFTEGGITTLSITNTSPAPTEPFICRSDGAINSRCEINFKPAGLVITDPNTITDIPPAEAGTNFTSKVRAIETNTTTGACQAAIEGPQTLFLGVEAINPVTLAGGSYTVNDTAVQLYDLGDRPAFPSLPSAVAVTFDSDGTASLTNNYSDVGQLRMAAFVSVPAQGANPAFSLSGTSINDYVVKPHTLEFTALNDDNSLPSVTTDEPVSGFKAAGEPFKGRIRSLNAAGELTANFGNEITPESVVANFESMVYPLPAAPMSNETKLEGESSFSGTNGEFFSDNLRWLEAGAVRILPELADGDYLGAGDISHKTAGSAGRFYPAKFLIDAVTGSTVDFGLEDAVSCSATGASYSYMGQPGIALSYKVLAVNTDGGVTRNYSHKETGSIDYAADLLAEIRPLTNFDSTFNPLERFSNFPTATNLWDEGKLIFEDAAISFNRLTNAPYVDGPYNGFHIGLVADAQPDGVDFESKTRLIDGTLTAPIDGEVNLRYGRAVLPQLAGGGFDEIPIEFGIEVYDRSLGTFVTHTDDSCYEVTQDFALTDNAGNNVTPSSLNETLGITLVEGELTSGTILLPRPAGYAVSKNPYRLEYQAEDWLRYEWDGEDNDYDEPPAARVFFDTYRGDDRIIFWLEQW